jgi:hypothetical protein
MCTQGELGVRGANITDEAIPKHMPAQPDGYTWLRRTMTMQDIEVPMRGAESCDTSRRAS